MNFQVGPTRVAINMPHREALMAEIAARFGRGEGFALATLNLDHLVKLRESAVFRDAYSAQDMVVADGNPVVWMSRLAGTPVTLIPGSELVEPLAELAARLSVPVALVGSTEAALAEAAEALRARSPDLVIAACIAPPMGFDPASPAGDLLLDEIAGSGAQLVFLALGAPKQEILAAKGRSVTPAIGFASIGAGLDFLAGHQTRAPLWVRRLALEWLWRMLSHPRRLTARYAKCFGILPQQVAQALRQRWS